MMDSVSLTEIVGTLNLFTDFIFGMMVVSDFLLIFAVGIVLKFF